MNVRYLDPANRLIWSEVHRDDFVQISESYVGASKCTAQDATAWLSEIDETAQAFLQSGYVPIFLASTKHAAEHYGMLFPALVVARPVIDERLELGWWETLPDIFLPAQAVIQ